MIYDVSLPLKPGLPVWPGDPPFEASVVAKPDAHSPFTVSGLSMSAHTGTHVDAPRHVFNDGKTVEQLDLRALIGRVQVIDARGVAWLTAEALDRLRIPGGSERVIFLTDNTRLWERRPWHFCTDFVAIDAGGARWLVEHGVRLVGVDYLSVAPYGQEVEPHQILLGAGIIVVEGLYLVHVSPGDYDLICLPLNLVGGEGAPARALLIDER